MSKLDELIAELCPDGVESKPLSEIATITRGGNLQKRTLLKAEFPAFITDRFTPNTACLLTGPIHSLVSQLLQSKRKLYLAISSWRLQVKI